jgi:hypothetical protein
MSPSCVSTTLPTAIPPPPSPQCPPPARPRAGKRPARGASAGGDKVAGATVAADTSSRSAGSSPPLQRRHVVVHNPHDYARSPEPQREPGATWHGVHACVGGVQEHLRCLTPGGRGRVGRGQRRPSPRCRRGVLPPWRPWVGRPTCAAPPSRPPALGGTGHRVLLHVCAWQLRASGPHVASAQRALPFVRVVSALGAAGRPPHRVECGGRLAHEDRQTRARASV